MTTKSLKTTLATDELKQLEQWVKAQGTSQQVALHSRIGLEAADGRSDLSIASALNVNRHTVRLWRHRIAQEEIGTVWEIASGRGRKARYGSRRRDRIIRVTLQGRPPGQTHGSCRTMAEIVIAAQQAVEQLQVCRSGLDDAHGQRPQVVQRASNWFGRMSHKEWIAVAEFVGRRVPPLRQLDVAGTFKLQQ